MKTIFRKQAFRFRMQTVLVLIAALAVAMSMVASEVNRERRKKSAIAEIKRLGGSVLVERFPQDRPRGVVNGWLRIFLGDDYFTDVRYVHLVPQTESDVTLLTHMREALGVSVDAANGSDELFQEILRFQQIENLGIENAKIDHDFLDSLSKAKRLSGIRFMNCSFDDGCLQSLVPSESMSAIAFFNCRLNEKDIQSLNHFEGQLNSIQFEKCGLNDSDLMALTESQKPMLLTIQEENITDNAIVSIVEKCPQWTVEFIGLTRFNNGVNRIHGSHEKDQIQSLRFHGSHITDKILAILPDYPNVSLVSLEACTLTDNGMRAISTLGKLETLFIYNIGISDDGINFLGDMQNLRDLQIYGTDVTGEGLQSLPESLRSLTLSRFPVDDAIPHLARLPNLNTLRISGGPFSVDVLDSLAELKSLETLDLDYIKKSDLARLQQRLVGCKISYDTTRVIPE